MRTFSFIVLLMINFFAQAQVTSLSAVEFKALIDKKNGLLLDTRSAPEFARGHIAGAMLIDLQSPTLQQTLLALPKNKPLYLYCYSGARSMNTAQFLVQNGYTNVFNMQRGLIDWSRNNFPLTTNDAAQLQPQPDAVTVEAYQKLVQKKGLLLIDFYAPWCVPCKQMQPMIEELKKEYAGRVEVIRANYDASKELANKLNVTTVPYFVFLRGSSVLYTKEGLTSKQELKTQFDKQVSTKK